MNSPNIVRSDDLKAENRHRILRTLRMQGALTRAEIGKATGLSQAALSTQFGLLTEQGVVTSENKDAKAHKRGRPKTLVSLDATAASVITIALTIDHVSFSLVDYAGDLQTRIDKNIPSRSLDTPALFDAITSGVDDLLASHTNKKLKSISIGFQGVTDVSSGELLWSPILSINKVPIGDMLSDYYGVSVNVNNDCGLIAKALHGSEKAKLGNSFAAVLFSHGIGLGVYLGDKPFTGAHSSALELGHVQFEKDGALCRCGKRGCIEAYAADYGILRAATNELSTKIPSGPISDQQMQELITAANNHDQSAIDAFKKAGKAVGFGLATVFTLLDPLPVALVGHNSDAVNLMITDIKSALSTVGRNPADYSQLLHCFQEDLPLLHAGLILDAMSVADRLFADAIVSDASANDELESA